MRKSVLTVAVAAMVGIGTVFGGVSVHTEAASLNSLKEEKSKVQSQRSDVKSDINDANAKINDIKSQQASVKDELKRLDLAIDDTKKNINDTTVKIESTKAEVAKLQEETEILKERIEKRNVLLKDRVRSYQETGGMVDYLDVLLGAKSFSDFIDRANAVATIMQADRDILKKHEADKKELEDKENQVKKDLASLETMAAELEKMKQKLNSQRAEKDKLLEALVEQEEHEHAHVMDLQEQEQILAAQEAAIQKAIQLEQEKQAAEAAAAAAAAAAAQSQSGGSAPAVSGGSAPTVASGAWTQPAAGRFTSGFGSRGGGMHYGVDIANSIGTPVVSAADGVVIRSYSSPSYGECIFVAHSVNGQTYTTVYAHLSKREVGNGAVVSKGQRIGLMGNTGDSRGPHLHFELHKGPWTGNKAYAINPRGIVPLP